MDIPINAEVRCKDGKCGRSTQVIVKPDAEVVTDVVVDPGFAAPRRVVPISLVRQTTPNTIVLGCTKAEMAEFPAFIEQEYVMPTEPHPDYEMGQYMLWPPSLPEEVLDVPHESIPLDEAAIDRGTRVEATDGRVGRVDEFIMEPGSGRITHLVLREGHLWGKREVTIPVTDIDHIDEDGVYLKLSKDEVGNLPGTPA